jgi:hypothetical protein
LAKIYLKEIGYDELDWIYMALDGDKSRALVNAILNLSVPCKARNLLRHCCLELAD